MVYTKRVLWFAVRLSKRDSGVLTRNVNYFGPCDGRLCCSKITICVVFSLAKTFVTYSIHKNSSEGYHNFYNTSANWKTFDPFPRSIHKRD